MERQAQKLTIDDKQKSEMQKEVFVLIRLIDMVEKCALLSSDRITSEEHHKQISKLLEKYNLFKSKIPGYDLQKFVKEYNLDDCTFAFDRIQSGPPKIKEENSNKLLVKLTSYFYRVQDLLLECQDDPKVSKLATPFEELIDLLQKAQVFLPNYNNYLKELQDFNARIFKTKYIMETLSVEEFTELSTICTEALRNFFAANN